MPRTAPVQEIKPYSARSCTDLFFALLFVAFWGATIYVVIAAKADGGDPNKIIRGQDAFGNVCGEGSEAGRPFVAWPFPPEFSYKMCVSDCSVTDLNASSQVPGHAITWPLTSTQIGWYCIPFNSEATELNIKFSGAFNAEFGTRSFGDIWTARLLICASAGAALVMAFLYTWFTKHCASCLVWGCILTLIAGGATASYFLLRLAGEQEDQYGQDEKVRNLRYLAYAVIICTSIFSLVILCLRTQIRLAVSVVKEAAKVMNYVPSLIVFPIVPIILTTGYIAVWLYIAVFIYSVGTDVEQAAATCAYQYHSGGGVSDCNGADSGNPRTMMVHEFDRPIYQNYLIAHVFGFFWNVQFLIYFGYMVIAGAVADWYFSSHENRKDLCRAPICGALARTLRFHLGSIAFGALILAVIQFVRAVLAYIQKKTMGADRNCVAKAIFCVVHCCLKCLECCIDKVNKNAFVWMSIWGDGFCSSCFSSFALIWRNLGRVAALNVVGSYLITLGKFTVASVTTGLSAYVLINTDIVPNLNSPVLPCICIFIVSWSVAYLFMVVFETVIDTTFLCFLVDSEHNAGGHMRASASLQALIGEHAKASEKEAALQHRCREMNFRGDIQENGYTRLDD